MSSANRTLPQLSGDLFITDGGIETTLTFHDGLDLPHFASFHLLRTEAGRAALDRNYGYYATLAERYRVGCVLEAATWRASRDWGDKLGYSRDELADANRQCVAMLQELRQRFTVPIVVSGNIGPRGDGYQPDWLMTADEAQQYHSFQAEIFREMNVDVMTSMTICYPAEAIGIVRAAVAQDLPVVISFTVETDGRLPTGQTLQSAIEEVDAATGRAPAYYMVNCAHPTHVERGLRPGEHWTERLRGLRGNASTMSHAELNDATELDDGNPAEFGEQCRAIRERLPHLNVLGGCCGTDHRHIEAICRACSPEMKSS